MDARDIINARRRAQHADNPDRFLALSSIFDNVKYPKDFKPTNIQKYDSKQALPKALYIRGRISRRPSSTTSKDPHIE